MHIQFSASGTAVDKYPAKAHLHRLVQQLSAASTPTGILVISATPSLFYPASDLPIPFRQDRNFFYLTGCNEPDTHATYSFETDKLTLWLPDIVAARVVWTGRGSTVEEALDRYDVDDAKYLSEAKKGREPWKRRGERVQYLGATNTAVGSVFPTSSSRGSDEALLHAIKACRVIKDSHELELIRRANAISGAAHTAVLEGLHAMNSEADVEAAYMATCIRKHARGQAYSPIAGAGANAAELHYVENSADFGRSQMLVLDAGCEVENYASDVTRAIPINKLNPGQWPSQEAKEIYALVERMQEQCIQEVRPGKMFVEIGRLAQRIAVEGLLALGILKNGTVQEILDAYTIGGFFPHGLGHHLGLDVHDVSPDPPPPATMYKTIAGTVAKWDTRCRYSVAWPLKPKCAARTTQGNLYFELRTSVHRELRAPGWWSKDGGDGSFGIIEWSEQASPPLSSDENRENNTLCPSLPVGSLVCANEEHVALTALLREASARHPDNVELSWPTCAGLNSVGWRLARANAVLRNNLPLLWEAVQIYFAAVDACAFVSATAEVTAEAEAAFPTPVQPPNASNCVPHASTLSEVLLQENIVITIEPGIYFNRFLLETFFLSDPKHARFIDTEVLERYVPVGGVRIEDDILVTRRGYENLTTAPKGEAMLKVIRRGAREARERSW